MTFLGECFYRVSLQSKGQLSLNERSPPRNPLKGSNLMGDGSSKTGFAELSPTMGFMLTKTQKCFKLPNQREAGTEHGMEGWMAVHNLLGDSQHATRAPHMTITEEMCVLHGCHCVTF